ncbi:MAG: site-specific DNA-methyltransferase [Thermoplasmata archaeon]|nr:site-specific DNA-methyltransferase [Thermoplasmata archaeon]MCI4362575.1 site-specific DNA-methyltransferase [Thermoplasmata archaeon]MCI4369729.1 site-specific DNA-methyltransferase [Thermoplasmata archaeon]
MDPVPSATIRTVHGDARELPGVAPGSVELIVTSPPYPMIPQWDETFHRWGATDYPSMHGRLGEVWAACFRALVPGGILAVNVGDALRSGPDGFRLWPNHVDVTRSCETVGFRSLPYVLWKKPTNKPNAFLGSGFLPPNAYVTLDCEFVLLFRRGGLRRLPPKDPRRERSRYTKAERDRWFSQVWDDVPGIRQSGKGRRTGAFPPEIPRRLIRMFSLVGDTVLDPFAGTGTTLWVAHALGRTSVGIDNDPELSEALAREAARLNGDRIPV